MLGGIERRVEQLGDLTDVGRHREGVIGGGRQHGGVVNEGEKEAVVMAVTADFLGFDGPRPRRELAPANSGVGSLIVAPGPYLVAVASMDSLVKRDQEDGATR